MSEIQDLTNRVNELSSSVSWWNTAIIVMMIFAAIAATGLVITQRIAFVKAELLSDTQELLISAKDAQIKRDLLDKDARIADANRAAGIANADAAQAKKETEELRYRNLEIQTSLTPRMLVVNNIVASRLRPFIGTPWILQVPAGDLEASSFGELLGGLLNSYQWKFVNGSTVHGQRFADGVIVSVRKDSPYWKAAVELVSYIEANRAHASLLDGDDAPSDSVLIRVGTKPRSALLEPVLVERDRKIFTERDQKVSAQMERARKEWHLPPYDK